MNNKKQGQYGVVLVAGAFSLLVLAPPSWSQPPAGNGGPGLDRPDRDRPDGEGPGPEFGGRGGSGRRGGPGMGGFGMGSPGMGGFDARLNSPKFQLMQWLEGVQRLEQGTQTTLSKSQAKQVLALTSPWQKKKAMSDKEATTLYTKLTSLLTPSQKTKIVPTGFSGGRFGPPGPEGRQGPPGGDRGGDRSGGRGPRGADRQEGFGGPWDDGPPNGGPPGGPPDGGPNGGPLDGGPGGFDGPGGFPGDGPPSGGRGDGFEGDPPGSPPRGPFGGGAPSFSEMKAQRETMRVFMVSNNPLASPKLNAQFAKLPAPMQKQMLERFGAQNDLFSRLKKKAK